MTRMRSVSAPPSVPIQLHTSVNAAPTDRLLTHKEKLNTVATQVARYTPVKEELNTAESPESRIKRRPSTGPTSGPSKRPRWADQKPAARSSNEAVSDQTVHIDLPSPQPVKSELAGADADQQFTTMVPATLAGLSTLKLTPAESKQAINMLLEELNQLEKMHFSAWPEREDLDFSKEKPKRAIDDAERQQRLKDTRVILADMAESDLLEYTMVGTFVGGRPAGFMALLPDDTFPPIIDLIVTHPQSRGAGKALIREGERISRELGRDGKLLLVPMHPHHSRAYEAMGFVSSMGQVMEYSPV